MKTLTVTSITVTPGTPDTIAIEGTITDTTPASPNQAMSVANVPATNPLWSRAVRLTDSVLLVSRYGANSVAMLLSSLVEIATKLEPTLTYAPRINTQPAAASVQFGSGRYADFTVVAVSETTPTYAWYESADGSTWGSALTTTGIYDVSVAGRLRITPTDTAKNGFRYKCTITNTAGSTTSSDVLLTVTA